MNNPSKHLLLILAVVFFSSCGTTEKEENTEKAADSTSVSTIEISPEIMEEVVKSIPSPVEISSLIKNSGSVYSPELLNSTDNIENYNTNFKKAVNLGIFGADLGYITIYEKNTDAISYIQNVKRLADDLRIGQFFDFNTLKRVASNKQNLDSLLEISNKGFSNMDNYLRKQDRANISVMILTAGWLEGLHLATSISMASDNPKLDERIGEQKISLDQLLLIVETFKNDKNMQLLGADLRKLKDVYDRIEITYTYQESTMVEVNGVLVVKDNSTSKVNITKEQIKEISGILEQTRNRLVK